ncbi:MAG: transketolase C-terminal domain-containing protein [Bacteroidota bacterium]
MQALIDGSRLMTEALVRAGADVFIGYPITPANNLYLFSGKRFKTFFAAPDEITTLQWMSGFSAAGKLPVTATSFPGFALMLESINMAYMMELPMVIILVQRLGPATGTATSGAQGDISLLKGMLSGGYSIPVISTSEADDCWEMSEKALKTAVDLRTPVILLTSKEEVMTQFSYDLDSLKEIKPVERKYYEEEETFIPYKRDERGIPEFLPVSNNKHQVRYTASTHNENGILEGISPAALGNTIKIHEKIENNLESFLHFELDKEGGSKTLLVSYGITANAATKAAVTLRDKGLPVSVLIPKTLLPISERYFEIMSDFEHIVIAEENHSGLYSELLFGARTPANVHTVNTIGRMISPDEIIEEVMKHGN